jgi:hypothetical protein
MKRHGLSLLLLGMATSAAPLACNDSTAQNLAAAIAAEAKPEPKPAPSALPTPVVTAAVATPLPSVAPVSLESLPAVAKFKQTNTYNGNVTYVPADCRGPYDVVLHFHGAHPYVKELVEKAGLHAVVTVFNAGNGAEKYAQAFGAGGTLSSLLRQITRAVAPLCAGSDAKPRRIALSAWSAGYGAVEKLLARPEDRERIDAVLLADGLHAGFTHPAKRQFAPNALQAFREFGELAKQGKKLFAITHSTIATDGYGSTTECSRLLLDALSVPCEGQLVSGHAGSFSIEGTPGADAPAHIQQFRRMDETLLSKLRVRWSKSPDETSGSRGT